MMKVCSKKKKHIAGQIIFFAVLLPLTAAAVAVPNVIPQSWADYYLEHIFGYVSFIPSAIATMFHFSLTELFVVVGGVMLLILLVMFFITFFRKAFSGGLLRFLLTVLKPLLVIVLIMAVLFDLMLGIGYRRSGMTKALKLERREYTYDEYLTVLEWAYNGMVSSRRKIGQDWRGVGHTARSFESNARYANSLIDAVSVKYDLGLSWNYVRSKPVAGSHVWSMTGIVGMYDPFLSESNINTDYMDVTSFPLTVCHEICHAKGVAREGDCNLLASIACIHSADNEFKYAGYYYIFMDLYPVVRDFAEHEGEEFPDYFSFPECDPVVKDTNAANAYWKSIHDTYIANLIHDIGTNINNMYLKSNGQSGGVATYHVPDNVYVDFYMTYIAAGDKSDA